MSSEGFVHPSTYRDADGNIAPENREAWLKSMEAMSKDRFIEIEELEVLRQRVSDCFKKEGVNHMDNCKAVVDAYTRFMAENGFSS
ncbi:uncharacterized protein [Blastocystis hominis]|uniref:Uncharacterized protein n=1 Tax=Blastocystis hominis TaxID=12968 RepID=D8LZ50_BLAHO|nr:uncharacterized protein [Blastocystis hominis]CBK21089.2 unnamed protein product [Blastocystis hominis]|eukprot:XP_012895137.1 uncharacterized protein [Blastocystis hominis]